MSSVVLLDTGTLGMIAHPQANREIAAWLGEIVTRGFRVLVPEISDYELRRELIRAALAKSLERLDALASASGYLPLTTRAMRRAAQLWASARMTGKQTAADKALDGDVILAAQALVLADEGNSVVVATEDGDLSRYCPAKRWVDIKP